MGATSESAITGTVLGMPVVLASLSLVALALGLAWWLRLGVQREVVVATARAAIQLLAVGWLFSFIFGSRAALAWAWLWVAVMVVVAAAVVTRRAGTHLDGLALVALGAIAASAAVSIGVTFGFGVVDYSPVSLVVVAGITIGNAVPSAVLSVRRSVDQGRDRVGELEALLSLGFDRRQVLRFVAPAVARTALIPQVERTKVVGLIALPGAMTGLLLAGVGPLEAVGVQLLVMYLVLGTAAVCVVSVVGAVMHGVVTPGLQVAEWVRPGSGRAD